MPSKQSETKVRTKIYDYLSTHGHLSGSEISKGLNQIIRGWLNYFEIKGVSYTKKSRRSLRYFLSNKLYRYYRRKSQRRSKLYEQDAFTQLVNKFNLIDPTKFFCWQSTLWMLAMNILGKPYAGKPHVRLDEGAGKGDLVLTALLYREKSTVIFPAELRRIRRKTADFRAQKM